MLWFDDLILEVYDNFFNAERCYISVFKDPQVLFDMNLI